MKLVRWLRAAFRGIVDKITHAELKQRCDFLGWQNEQLRLQQAANDLTHLARSKQNTKSKLRGKLYEELAPMLPGFPYDPEDAQHIGGPLMPVDYIIWRNLKDVDADLEIVFLDIKTGRGRFTKNQRRIRDAIAAGRIEVKLHYADRPDDEAS